MAMLAHELLICELHSVAKIRLVVTTHILIALVLLGRVVRCEHGHSRVRSEVR